MLPPPFLTVEATFPVNILQAISRLPRRRDSPETQGTQAARQGTGGSAFLVNSVWH